MITKNNQKGVSIYLIVVMISVLLSAVLGTTSIIIGGVRIAESLGYSVKAFHVADTGIEEALYNIKNTSGTCDNSTSDGTFGTGYTWDVTMTNAGNGNTDCSATGTEITSSGTYRTVNRKIGASY